MSLFPKKVEYPFKEETNWPQIIRMEHLTGFLMVLWALKWVRTFKRLPIFYRSTFTRLDSQIETLCIMSGEMVIEKNQAWPYFEEILKVVHCRTT